MQAIAQPHRAPERGPMSRSDVEQQIRELAARGEKIQAIKLLREATGWGLAEAKAAVDALEAGRALPELPTVVARPTAPSDLPPDVRATAEGGNRILAIKMLRERTGLGLAEAKDWLDRAVPATDSGKRGCLPVLLAGLALGAATWWRS